MKIAIIIVAAGRGARVGGDLPKQYRKLGQKSVISVCLSKFEAFDDLIIVINPSDRTFFDEATKDRARTYRIIAGGQTRTESVRAGLTALAASPPDYVLIHDGARPCISNTVINDVIAGLSKAKAAVPALPIVDAVKTLDAQGVDRDKLRRVQTPQGFHFTDIFAAYEALPAGESFVDDIEMARRAGLSIIFTKGDPDNIKVTYAKDFELAEHILGMDKKDMISVTGQGFDVHRLIEAPHMWLCGVKIEGTLGLLGHSDADVGLHSLTDAILGALALGDIGDHFPPSDERWSGASSDLFLKHALSLAAERGAKLVHIDITLICERPKVKPHREAMRARLSELTGLPLSHISVKATTTEGLGFTGRAEGVACQACASLRVPVEP